MIAATVFLMCALTSILCTLLLYLRYRSSRFRLLLWSSIGFLGLSLNNILLFIDLILIPDGPDLSVVRTIPALLGFGILVWGFIWDATT